MVVVVLLARPPTQMDPTSAMFQRMFSNPFAFAGFKSTEPWLEVRGGACA